MHKHILPPHQSIPCVKIYKDSCIRKIISPTLFWSSRTLLVCTLEDATATTVRTKCNIVGEEQKRVAAHKFMLAARSEFFAALLSGKWQDGQGDELAVLLDEENGVRVETFLAMIDFIYGASVVINHSTHSLAHSPIPLSLTTILLFSSICRIGISRRMLYPSHATRGNLLSPPASMAS